MRRNSHWLARLHELLSVWGSIMPTGFSLCLPPACSRIVARRGQEIPSQHGSTGKEMKFVRTATLFRPALQAVLFDYLRMERVWRKLGLKTATLTCGSGNSHAASVRGSR